MIYHKIETLYERDERTHKLARPFTLKNPVYGIIKEWEFTEKIDGTNIRIMWSPSEGITFGGRTDNAQLPADLVNILKNHVTEERLRAVFGETPAVVYGEGYGAGIQKGAAYRPDKAFIAYDVLVDAQWWLSRANVCDVCNKLGLEVVPFVGVFTIEQATAYVENGFKSAIGTAQAEGLVGRTCETLFDKKFSRLIIKLKTKDF